ncbi:hypothetical protein SESBI_13743 [Sesbania bispinosa]|nr:hypothetical protein SESBI_13743 [Sesbania bispinosa]
MVVIKRDKTVASGSCLTGEDEGIHALSSEKTAARTVVVMQVAISSTTHFFFFIWVFKFVPSHAVIGEVRSVLPLSNVHLSWPHRQRSYLCSGRSDVRDRKNGDVVVRCTVAGKKSQEPLTCAIPLQEKTSWKSSRKSSQLYMRKPMSVAAEKQFHLG